jgi:hypothetical protein
MMNTIQIVAMLMERFANKFPSEIRVGGFGEKGKTVYVVTFPYGKKVKFSFNEESDDVYMEYALEDCLIEYKEDDFLYTLAASKDNKEIYPFKVFEMDGTYDCYDEQFLLVANLHSEFKKEEFTTEVLDALVNLMLKPTPTMKKLFSL